MNIETQLIREKIIQSIRIFFLVQNFREIETPLLVTRAGTDPYIDLFETVIHIPNKKSMRAFLTTSPELSMKKIISQGFGDCFQICKSFRNGEGLSDAHNHEFTILEWYRTDADYFDIMSDTQQLLRFVYFCLCSIEDMLNYSPKALYQMFQSFTDTLSLTYQQQVLELPATFERITILDAFDQYAGMTRKEVLKFDNLKKVSEGKGYSVTDKDTWETLYNQIFLNEIEPHLGKKIPTCIYDYPASQAALSVRKKDDPEIAERFELYWGGMELGNAFTELSDPVEQRQRMESEIRQQKKLGKLPTEIDEVFIRDLAQMPPTGGIALGVDRLVMLFANVASIQEVIHFPISRMV